MVNPTCGQYLIAGEALWMCSEWLTGLAWFPWGLTSVCDAHRFFLEININIRLEVLEKIWGMFWLSSERNDLVEYSHLPTPCVLFCFSLFVCFNLLNMV